MATGLKASGETDIIDTYFGQTMTVYVGLYNEATDALADDATLANITTEPADGSYARLSYDLATDFTTSTVGGDRQAVVSNLSFNVDGTTGTVDAYFVIDGTNNLLWTGALDSSRTLNDITTLNVDQAGIKLD